MDCRPFSAKEDNGGGGSLLPTSSRRHVTTRSAGSRFSLSDTLHCSD